MLDKSGQAHSQPISLGENSQAFAKQWANVNRQTWHSPNCEQAHSSSHSNMSCQFNYGFANVASNEIYSTKDFGIHLCIRNTMRIRWAGLQLCFSIDRTQGQERILEVVVQCMAVFVVDRLFILSHNFVMRSIVRPCGRGIVGLLLTFCLTY